MALTSSMVVLLAFAPSPPCGERATPTLQQARLGEGRGRSPHPIFSVESPSGPLPTRGRGRNNDLASTSPPQIHLDHPLIRRHLIDRALGQHRALVQAGDLDA